MGPLIHRQILEFKFMTEATAKRWSPRLSELNQQIILPELERVFAEQVGAENLLRIDKLDIDLGHLSPIDLENDLAARVRRVLCDALQPHLHEALPLAVVNTADTQSKQNGRYRSEASPLPLDTDSFCQLFELFLRTGRCPWWLETALASRLDYLYRCFWQDAPLQAEKLLRQIMIEPLALQRFVEQFSSQSHRLTMQRLLRPAEEQLLGDLRKLAMRLLVHQGFGSEQARTLSFQLVYRLIGERKSADYETPAALLRHFFSALGQLCDRSPATLAEELDRAVAGARLAPITRQALAALLTESASVPARPAESSRLAASIASSQVEDSELDNGLETGIAVAIDNAGLVLLWPHLKELLEKLELLQTRKDGTQRPSIEAALLLQQLVTGRPAGQENLLALNKLLCGIPQAVPLPRRRRRNVRWDAEVEALLSTVIKQWAVLKNTSVAGLRSGFLQRPGLLRQQPSGWLLLVERQAQDVLLEQLPWGLGMIRFSWMRQPLTVEW